VELTPEQRKAVDLSVSRIHKGVPLTTVFGPAGTGKTTVAKFIVSAVEQGEDGSVAVVAPTGKAALVLRRKGLPARTVHSLIYRTLSASEKELQDLTKQMERATTDAQREVIQQRIDMVLDYIANPRFVLREELDDAYRAIVLDESSMVSGTMLADLMSFGIPVLALGDPAQLPPVNATSPLSEEGYHPTIMLTTPHRFAEASPVFHFANAVRLGGPGALSGWREGSGVSLVGSFVLDERQIDKAMSFDQIICGANNTRHMLNAAVRTRLGRPADELDDEDRMVCLRNEPRWDLVNGEQYTVKELAEQHNVPEAKLMAVEGWQEHFPLFGYGYAVTCHKSQGSEWPRVLVLDQSRMFRADAGRWLYTAVTRAADTVVVLRIGATR
jgi:exodeoxyribonuclease-5